MFPEVLVTLVVETSVLVSEMIVWLWAGQERHAIIEGLKRLVAKVLRPPTTQHHMDVVSKARWHLPIRFCISMIP